ncbi:MAG: non-hydrolyzing UDP-N-acetylglucosamine 2-epimerase [Candidatus Bathyarchaeia archaeon]
MTIVIAVGTRPEIIKMAPVVYALRRVKADFLLVHTYQHYDQNMNGTFFKGLRLPKPDVVLDVPKEASHAVQTSSIMIGLERVLEENGPTLMAVEGDTNSVVAASLTAVKGRVPLAHIEAGLRSYDMRMPEEHNRKIADHLSSMLFAPTWVAEANLMKEGVRGRIYLSGNPVIDACNRFARVADRKSTIMDEVKFDEFILATIHRPENVDYKNTLSDIVTALVSAPEPVVFPIHPRTVKMLKYFGLYEKLAKSRSVQLIEPLGYVDFLKLMKESSLVITDSGGIQEEATAPSIRKFVLVVRKATERPEAVEAGFAKVVGTNPERIVREAKSHLDVPLPSVLSPFGDGKAGEHIAKIMVEELERGFTIDFLPVGVHTEVPEGEWI